MTITLTREEAQQVLDALTYVGDAKEIYSDTIETLRARLAQPEPEPVAWRFDQARYRENDLRGRRWAFNVFSQTKPYMDEMVRNVTPLYTAPPQREWQGLTDEESAKCWSTSAVQSWKNIEAKLKEKNNAP